MAIHCDCDGSFASHMPAGALDTTATKAVRGLKCGSSLRATSCQCGSGWPSSKPAPVLNSLIGTRSGIQRAKRPDGAPPRVTRTTRSRSSSTRADSFAPKEIARPSASVPAAGRTSILPRKTCECVAPDFSTSTPNSVPRSVTTAVGVLTTNKGLGIRDWELELSDFGFRISDFSTLAVSLPRERKPPEGESTS